MWCAFLCIYFTTVLLPLSVWQDCWDKTQWMGTCESVIGTQAPFRAPSLPLLLARPLRRRLTLLTPLKQCRAADMKQSRVASFSLGFFDLSIACPNLLWRTFAGCVTVSELLLCRVTCQCCTFFVLLSPPESKSYFTVSDSSRTSTIKYGNTCRYIPQRIGYSSDTLSLTVSWSGAGLTGLERPGPV